MLIDLTRVYTYVCVDNATSPVALPVSFSKLARTSHGLITFNSMRQLPGNTLDPDDQAAQAASHPSEPSRKFLRGPLDGFFFINREAEKYIIKREERE